MKIRGLLTDDDAVSSVIAVVLLVAIVVILGAAVGSSAFSVFASPPTPAEQASFAYSSEKGQVRDIHDTPLDSYFNASHPSNQSNVTVRITHRSGDTIAADQLQVTVEGEQAWAVVGDELTGTFTRYPFSNETIGSGDSTVIALYGSNVSNNTRVDDFNGDVNSLPELNASEIRAGDTVRIVWTASDGENSAIVSEHTVSS